MFRRCRCLAGAILGILVMVLVASPAQAKYLQQRLGIGFKNQYYVDLPSIAVQYYPSAQFGLSAAVGVQTQDGQSKFGTSLKALRIIFMEDNLNFYMGGGVSLISNQLTANNSTESGFELNGFAGCEFFFDKLENLGFSFETGFAVTSMESGVHFRTIGDGPWKAGIIFYF